MATDKQLFIQSRAKQNVIDVVKLDIKRKIVENLNLIDKIPKNLNKNFKPSKETEQGSKQ